MFKTCCGKKRYSRLESLAAPIREQGIEVETKLLEGKTSVEIVREVIRGEHDLVVAVAKGSNSRHSGFFGNTARRLLRHCPSAVWLVAPETDRTSSILWRAWIHPLTTRWMPS